MKIISCIKEKLKKIADTKRGRKRVLKALREIGLTDEDVIDAGYGALLNEK